MGHLRAGVILALFFGTTIFIVVPVQAIALALRLPLARTFLDTGLVPRVPTVILVVGLVIVGVLSCLAGLILDTVTRGRWETKRLRYLQFPPPGP